MTGERRLLSRAEKELWEKVCSEVKPLRLDEVVTSHVIVKKIHLPCLAEVVPSVILSSSKEYSIPPAMDTRLKRKIERGNCAIDNIIDLHGLRYGEAHRSLFQFLKSSRLRGDRIVLIITGKGGRDARSFDDVSSGFILSEGQGVLQRATRDWLNQPLFSEFVLSFSDAHRHHGGSGAIYAQLHRCFSSSR